jgi:hypothetical protein
MGKKKERDKTVKGNKIGRGEGRENTPYTP